MILIISDCVLFKLINTQRTTENIIPSKERRKKKNVSMIYNHKDQIRFIVYLNILIFSFLYFDRSLQLLITYLLCDV